VRDIYKRARSDEDINPKREGRERERERERKGLALIFIRVLIEFTTIIEANKNTRRRYGVNIYKVNGVEVAIGS
jgi:hypothetical protein